MPETSPAPRQDSVPTCPRCGGLRSQRVKRRGVMQLYILSALGRFPWECGGCRMIFTAPSRGKRKRRSSSTT